MSTGDRNPDTRIKRRFECRECGSPSTVHVHPNDVETSIRYACSGECGVSMHDPAGVLDWFNQPD